MILWRSREGGGTTFHFFCLSHRRMLKKIRHRHFLLFQTFCCAPFPDYLGHYNLGIGCLILVLMSMSVRDVSCRYKPGCVPHPLTCIRSACTHTGDDMEQQQKTEQRKGGSYGGQRKARPWEEEKEKIGECPF